MVKTLGSRRHNALIQRIIEAREEAGMTQTELAAKLGEYQSFVARLESGQRRVDVVELIAFGELMRFDPCEMVRAIQSIDDNQN